MTRTDTTDRFHGIYAIVYALFDAAERLDEAAMRRQVRLCLDSGVHGMAALGLATEVAKLTEAERCQIMDWVADETAGRVPLAFTIFGASVAEQVAQIRHAEKVGADWVILQPPMAGRYGAGTYLDFFARVMEATTLPVAIQNAPAFLGFGLTASEVERLRARCPNFVLIKAEGTIVEIAQLMEATERRLPVFNGRAGLEMIDNLNAGCRGFILAPDCIDHAVRIYEHFRAGEIEEAEAIYRSILPSITFVMQGIEHLVGYGKRLYGLRSATPIHDRQPALAPSQAGETVAAGYATQLGPLGEGS